MLLSFVDLHTRRASVRAFFAWTYSIMLHASHVFSFVLQCCESLRACAMTDSALSCSCSTEEGECIAHTSQDLAHHTYQPSQMLKEVRIRLLMCVCVVGGLCAKLHDSWGSDFCASIHVQQQLSMTSALWSLCMHNVHAYFCTQALIVSSTSTDSSNSRFPAPASLRVSVLVLCSLFAVHNFSCLSSSHPSCSPSIDETAIACGLLT